MAPESESDFGFLDEVSNGESTAAPGSTSEGEGFYATTSSARWRSLCAAAADPGCRLAELPALLAPLVAELPLRFARYAYQLAVGAPPEPDNEVMGLFQSSNPTMTGHRRLRVSETSCLFRVPPWQRRACRGRSRIPKT